MNKYLSIVIVACCFLVGCGKNYESTENLETKSTENLETKSTENLETKNKEHTETIDTYKFETLTLDALEGLAQKHKSLRLEDFEPYMDITSLIEKGSLFEIIKFTYNGKNMFLRISASDKKLVAAPYDGSLDGAVIFHEEFLELDTIEQEYEYKGSCADIRSGNLNNILNGKVKMEDYINVSLPDELKQSDYKYWMGSHGGVAFVKEDMNEEITIENAGIYAENPLDGGIEIWGNGEFRQNMEMVKAFTPIELGNTMLHREIWQTEQGINWYVAYTDQDDSTISYCFYLNKDKYELEEFLNITNTILLEENAIY